MDWDKALKHIFIFFGLLLFICGVLLTCGSVYHMYQAFCFPKDFAMPGLAVFGIFQFLLMGGFLLHYSILFIKTGKSHDEISFSIKIRLFLSLIVAIAFLIIYRMRQF